MIPQNRPIRIEVTHQGAPIVNSACIDIEHDDIVTILIDLKSKYCDIGATTDDGIWISTTNESIQLMKDKNMDDSTKVVLVDYKDWKIFAVECSRYTVRVCLTNLNYVPKDEATEIYNLLHEYQSEKRYNCVDFHVQGAHKEFQRWYDKREVDKFVSATPPKSKV